MTQNDIIWQILSKAVINNTNWYGWVLTYITKNCLHLNIRQNAKDPFKLNHIRTIESIRNKIPNNLCAYELLKDFEKMVCIEIEEFDEPFLQEKLLDIMFDIENKDILIIMSKNILDNDYIDAMRYMEYLNFNDIKFELTTHISFFCEGIGDRWNGEIFSRHGNDFKKFWYQQRSSKIVIKKDLSTDLKIGHEYIFVYQKVRRCNYESLRHLYLKLLGGQDHVRCMKHKEPVIVTYRKEKCQNCGKNSFYCCNNNDACNIQLCQKCFSEYDINTISYIDELDIDTHLLNESENQNNEIDESSDIFSKMITMKLKM